MLEWTLDALRECPDVERIVVALPEGAPRPRGCLAVAGGEQRSHSVRNALQAAGGGVGPILVCDAARPLLEPVLVERCLAAIASGADGAVAAAPVVDTIKEADDERRVVRTPPRARLWAVQTPQAFARAALDRALARPDDELATATDDASLVEADGGDVRIVPWDRPNLKVTTPHDLEVAERLLRAR